MGKLEGKIAVITGGTSGMALASAKLFVEEGAYVFITGRNQEQIDEAIKVIGRNVTGVQGDAANLEDLDRLFDIVKREKGKIDVLFASAGIGEPVPLWEITEQHFDKTFDLNVRGTLFTVQKALPLFNDGGSIFMTGSQRCGERFPWFRRVCGEQVGAALLRPYLAQRAEAQKDPREPAGSRCYCHTDAGSSSHQGSEAVFRIPHPTGNDGSI
jgi:NAD(P)-dependent dehydrogenase (short-subunit alcohol dehydrogenase family)